MQKREILNDLAGIAHVIHVAFPQASQKLLNIADELRKLIPEPKLVDHSNGRLQEKARQIIEEVEGKSCKNRQA